MIDCDVLLDVGWELLLLFVDGVELLLLLIVLLLLLLLRVKS